MTDVSLESTQGNPYPGLRPFQPNEEHLFFGRESQVDAMVDKLGATSFLAVVGTSGCGKSSLVNCGLKPALHRGMLASAGTSWRIAHMRPGVSPIANLAEALAEDGILFKNAGGDSTSRLAVIDTTLRMSKLGLIDMVEQARLDANTRLCIVVDQFEELFRFSALAGISRDDADGISEEAIEFVNLLLAVKEAHDLPIYVVLTMRSDFLGDCAKFNGLPEAINDGQYLVPRLTREERRAAISGPASVAGGKISPVLLTRLVNDVGDNPDQLSILQHALNRTWAHWQKETGSEGPLELVHYEAIGTMQKALDEHAENAYAELGSDETKAICERIFRALTDTATDSRGVRRPTKMDLLCELAGASHEEVTHVIDVFRVPSRSFLMPPHGEDLEPDQVIDISHESLMRGWQRLMSWANEEAKSARMYQRLAETAQLHAANQAGYWRDPDLQLGLNWLETEKPNARWAERYHPDFDTALEFLKASADQQEQENLDEQAEKQRKKKLTSAIVATSTAIVIISAFLYQALLLHWEAQRNWSVSVSNEAAFNALRLAETKDPLHGALLALRLLNVDPNEASQGEGAFFKGSLLALKQLISGPETLDPRAIPAIERTLWTSWSKMHVHKIIYDHGHQVRAIAVSPNGQYLASASLDRTVKVYDTNTWTKVADLSDGNGKFYAVDFSPDGKYMVTGSRFDNANKNSKNSARLWDTSTWTEVREFVQRAIGPHANPPDATHASAVRTVAFSEDGERLATVSWDNTAIVWDVASGAMITQLRGHTASVLFAAFHPTKNNILVTGGVDRKAMVWDTSKADGEKMIASFTNHTNGLNSVEFAPDGKSVLTSSNDDTVRIWDWQTGRRLTRPLEAHGSDIWRAIYNREGDRFFTASWDRTIGVWNSTTLKQIRKLVGHDSALRSLAIDSDRELLYSSAVDGTVRAWRLETDDVLDRRKEFSGIPLTAKFHPSNPTLYAVAGENGLLEVWKMGAANPTQSFAPTKKLCGRGKFKRQCGAHKLAYSNDARRIVALYESGRLRIWDPETGGLIGEPIIHFSKEEDEEEKAAPVVAFAIADDMKQVITASKDGQILFWDIETGAQVSGKSLRLESNFLVKPSGWRPQVRMAYSAKTQRLAMTATPQQGQTHTAVWDFKKNAILPNQKKTPHKMSVLKFAPDGKHLVMALDDYSLVVWHPETDKSSRYESGHEGTIEAMEISPNGKRLATASDDETIRVYDIASRHELVSLGGHERSVISLSFSSDGLKLASVAEDQTVLVRHVFADVWALRDHMCIQFRSINVEPKIKRKFGDEPTMQLDELCPQPTAGN